MIKNNSFYLFLILVLAGSCGPDPDPIVQCPTSEQVKIEETAPSFEIDSGNTLTFSNVTYIPKQVDQEEGDEEKALTIQDLEKGSSGPGNDQILAKGFIWDFGDGSKDTTQQQTVNHNFTKVGEFKVVLNYENCGLKSREIPVKVKSIKIDQPNPPDPIPTIEGPAKVNVGQPVTYRETSGLGSACEWYMNESGICDGKKREIEYKFKTPGKKTIMVKLAGIKSKTTSFDVLVKHIPCTNCPKGPTDAEIEKHLAKWVNSGQLNEADYINRILKGNQSTPVTVNGKNYGSFSGFANNVNAHQEDAHYKLNKFKTVREGGTIKKILVDISNWKD